MGAYLWFGLMVLFLIVEAACPVHLVSIWFAAGALAAAVTGLLHGQLWLQIVVFFVVSVGLLAMLLPFVRKVLNPHLEKTNVDSILGSQGYIIEDVDNLNAVGRVKLGGMEWTARSTDGKPIPAGTLVQVDKIEGVKAFVTMVHEKVKN